MSVKERVKARQQSMGRVGARRLPLREQLPNGGHYSVHVDGADQRHGRLIENLGEFAIERSTDELSPDAGCPVVEAGEKSGAKVAQQILFPGLIRRDEPQPPETADQEIIARWRQPWSQTDDATRCSEHLVRSPLRYGPSDGHGNSLTPWHGDEASWTSCATEDLCGHAQSVWINFPWDTIRGMVVGDLAEPEADAAWNFEARPGLVHRHSRGKAACLNHSRESAGNAEAERRNQPRPAVEMEEMLLWTNAENAGAKYCRHPPFPGGSVEKQGEACACSGCIQGHD
jgi:hypothetical protein